MVETLLEVRNLSKTFRYRTGLIHRQTVDAVKPLSFTLRLNTNLEPEARRKRVFETLRMVGLLPDHESYYPHMLAPPRNSVWDWRVR